MVKTEFIDSDNCLCAFVDSRLCTGGSFLDLKFRKSGFDSLRHTAEFLDFLNMFPSTMSDFVGKRLYIIAASPRVNLFGDICLVLNVNLRVTGDSCREVGRQRDSLVKRVCMQRLGMSENGSHSLHTCAANVVERILLCQRPA